MLNYNTIQKLDFSEFRELYNLDKSYKAVNNKLLNNKNISIYKYNINKSNNNSNILYYSKSILTSSYKDNYLTNFIICDT